ncbi:MAG: cell division protein FtsA [Marinilabiliales bacterium]
MDKKYKTIAAIDIGTTKIVSIIGRKDENGVIDILGLGKSPSKGVRRGLVYNIEEAVGAINNAVSAAKEMSGIDFDEVYVGIAGQYIRSLRMSKQKYIDSKIGEIKKEDVDSLTQEMYKIPVEPEEEILHVIPQEYIVDGEISDQPVGVSGKVLEGNFHIVVAQVTSAFNIKKCIERVNLNTKELILEPIASAHAVLTEDEKEAGVALVDIGGGTTDIAIYYDKIIKHTAVIPFGGNVITSDIRSGFKILERYAEQLKIKFGSALPEETKENEVVTVPGISGREPKEISLKNLAYIINARMVEIIGAIKFQIESSGIADKLGAGIVITGGGAMLKHLPQLFSYETGMDVRIGLPNRYLKGKFADEINKSMYSTSVGLILKGYEDIEKNSDPYEYTEEQKEKKKDKKEKDKKSGKKITSLLKQIGGIFDDNDNTF